jgi:hypothetical protein
MKNHVRMAAQKPEVLPQVADLVWGAPFEKIRAVDALVACADRAALPILCERIADDSLEVVAYVLSRIDRLDPVTGVLVAREMSVNGHPDHLQIVHEYFACNAPWELLDGGPELRSQVRGLAESYDVPRLLRALLDPRSGLRRAAIRRLLAVADVSTLRELEVHLEPDHRVISEGILDLLLRVSLPRVYACARDATWEAHPSDEPMLMAMARVGGLGTMVLLDLYMREGSDLAEEALLRYQPRELLVRCRRHLASGNREWWRDATDLLLALVDTCWRSRPMVHRAAIETLVSLFQWIDPEIQSLALYGLSRTQAPHEIATDVTPLLQHPEVRSSIRGSVSTGLGWRSGMTTSSWSGWRSTASTPECGMRAFSARLRRSSVNRPARRRSFSSIGSCAASPSAPRPSLGMPWPRRSWKSRIGLRRSCSGRPRALHSHEGNDVGATRDITRVRPRPRCEAGSPSRCGRYCGRRRSRDDGGPRRKARAG